MRPRIASRPKLLLGVVGLVAAFGLAACDHTTVHLDVVPGEPLELGELEYHVQISRQLNPADAEDAAYLRNADPAGDEQEYLGVFLRIRNHGERDTRIATSFGLRDTRGTTFSPVPIDNPFALEPGAEIAAEGEIPGPDTPAASGPIRGAMLLYLVDLEARENRPVKLEIPGPDGETGTIELDI